MKINKLLFTVLFLTLNFFSFSQEECGTDEILRRNPFLQQMQEERVNCAPEVDLDSAQVLTLPIVFHVVHLGESIGEGTNISDEQIISCVENLNHRFRGNIESLSNLTDEYDEDELSLVIDSKIEFCLAVRDPDGNPTNGINRVNGINITYNGESYLDDGIAMDATNNGVVENYLKSEVGCWDVDKYINFYVVSEINGNNGGNGIQGYAYLGPTNNCQDGIVCLYNVVGTEGNLKSTHNLNATVTHEMGHHLSLLHTFWLSNDCTSETNPCSQGDQCPDTPKTTYNNSCNTPECPDAMLENYMDYTPQSCRVAFTQNQIERMRNSILTERSDYIYDNLSCQPLNGFDLAITTVTLPSSWCREEISFNVKINNFGGNTVTGAQIQINGATYPLPPIPGSDFFILGFTNFNIGDGIFNIEVIYPEDQYIDNNTYYHEVEISNELWTEVTINTDVWATEIYWEILNEEGDIVLSDGNYPFGQNTHVLGTCLPEGCYTFRITDSAGDGMCTFDTDNDGICDLSGSFNIVANGITVLELSDPSEIDYGFEGNFEFCLINCPTSECDGDFNGDGLVTVRDLIELLATPQGQLIECSEFDLNNDLVISTSDVLDFLNIMGYNCYTGEYYEVGMISLDKVSDLPNICHVMLDKTIIDVNYYTLRGERMTFNRFVSDGIYLKETIYSDGTKDVTKVFINK